MRKAAAQAQRVYRPGGRRLHLPPGRHARPAASRAMPHARPMQDEAHEKDLSVVSEARWAVSSPKHPFWGGAALSLGLHLGVAALAFALAAAMPDGASMGEESPATIEVEIVGAEAFDATFAASGAAPQVEAEPDEMPLPDIPLPPDLPLPTERDLLPEAAIPDIPPPPSKPMPDPVEVIEREIKQAEPKQEVQLPPPDTPKPQPQKPVAKAEASRKPAPKVQPKPRREAARGQGRSGEDADATSSLAASRGAPGRAGASNAGANASFRSRVLAHLARYKRYPEAARIQRLRGRVTVTFSLDASGAVTGVSLAGSSGYGILDTEALAMVRRASPFPRIPPELGQTSASFTAPITYDLN